MGGPPSSPFPKPTVQAPAAVTGWAIAYSIDDVDRAMRWGFGWELGPFETWAVSRVLYLALFAITASVSRGLRRQLVLNAAQAEQLRSSELQHRLLFEHNPQPMLAYAEDHHVFLHGFKNTKTGEGHWNEQGHRLAGELIAARLCAMITSGQAPAVMKETAGGGAAAR